MAEDEKSEFNMALEFLRTLRATLNECDYASTELDLYRWYNALLVLRRELSPDMNEQEMQKVNEFKNSLHDRIQQFRMQQARGRPSRIEPGLYDTLDEFELFLRKIIKKMGYQGRMQSALMRAMQ